MALSGPRANKGLLHEIRQIISKHGLKSHKAHKFLASEPKVITGVCITADGPRVPNKLHRKIKNGFESLSLAKTSSERVKALGPLLGRMEAAGQIDPTFKARAKTLRDQQLILFESTQVPFGFKKRI